MRPLINTESDVAISQNRPVGTKVKHVLRVNAHLWCTSTFVETNISSSLP